MAVLIDPWERAELRSYLAATLPETCAVQSVHPTTGARTTIATAACRVVYPRGGEGGAEWLGDQRVARVLLPPGTTTAGADLIAVSDGPTYRIVAQDPDRYDDLLRSVSVVESRESGGPV